MCWRVWNLARAYRTTPSDFLNIDDPIAATYLDQAIATYGMRVENAITEAVGDKTGPQAKMASDMTLALWLGEEGKPQQAQKFRDPAEVAQGR
jgi:hypothetical protein